jgi:hypothetical protein
MSELLVGLTRGGGAPPPSFERVEVLADGTVRAVVATASGATRADLAGRFELRLNGDRLAELERLATEAAEWEPRTADAPRPGAGRTLVTLPGGRRIALSPFAKLDDPQATLVRRLDELRAEVREHPQAAVRLEVTAPETAAVGEATELTFVLTAIGSAPVALSVRSLSTRLVPGRGADPPPVLWVREAQPVEGPVAQAVELAPDESLTLRARGTAVPAAPGPHRLDGFADVALGTSDPLNAVLAAGPVALAVS